MNDKEVLEQRMRLFEHEGWAELVKDWEQLITVTGDVSSLESTKAFWKAKGFCEALRLMTNLEELTKQLLDTQDDL